MTCSDRQRVSAIGVGVASERAALTDRKLDDGERGLEKEAGVREIDQIGLHFAAQNGLVVRFSRRPPKTGLVA